MARIDGVTDPGLSFARLVFFAVKRRLGHVPRPTRIQALDPPVLRGGALMESAQESASALPGAIKKLAQVRVATRVGCPF